MGSTAETPALPSIRPEYRPRGPDPLRTLFRQRFSAFQASYEQRYAAFFGKFRLPLISRAASAFRPLGGALRRLCGDWYVGLSAYPLAIPGRGAPRVSFLRVRGVGLLRAALRFGPSDRLVAGALRRPSRQQSSRVPSFPQAACVWEGILSRRHDGTLYVDMCVSLGANRARWPRGSASSKQCAAPQPLEERRVVEDLDPVSGQAVLVVQ